MRLKFLLFTAPLKDEEGGVRLPRPRMPPPCSLGLGRIISGVSGLRLCIKKVTPGTELGFSGAKDWDSQ